MAFPFSSHLTCQIHGTLEGEASTLFYLNSDNQILWKELIAACYVCECVNVSVWIHAQDKNEVKPQLYHGFLLQSFHINRTKIKWNESSIVIHVTFDRPSYIDLHIGRS